MQATKVIFVEGNIGSGKSKFLSQIETSFGEDCQVIYEPLDTWTSLKDKDGVNVLDHFYKDPKKYAYTFQNIAFMSKIKKLEEIDFTKKYVFIERSIWSDKHIFAKNCYMSGLINEIEFQVYNVWFDWIEKNCNSPKKTFIYLKCSPETSFGRIHKRGRAEEKSVPIEYISQIHECHEIWANLGEEFYIIDAELDLTNKDVFIEEYKKFINYL